MDPYLLKTKTGAVYVCPFLNPENKLIIQEITLSPKATEPQTPFYQLPADFLSLLKSLEVYFASGEPLPSIPWDILYTDSCTPFQLSVYRAIEKIPHGETRTYAWVAKKTGNPKASQAVGQALRKNPFPVLIPCHRVVSQTSIGGFMGKCDLALPELKLKQWLIDLEYRFRNPVFAFLQESFA